MLFLLLIGVITAGAFAVHMWSQKDVYIHRTVQEKLAEIFPTCDVSFESFQINNASRFTLTDFQLKSQADQSPLLTVDQIELQIDELAFRKFHRIVVKKIEIDAPQVFAIRDENGTWNWQQIQLKPSEQKYSPALTINNGVLQVGLRSIPNGPLHTVTTRAFEFEATPESLKCYQLDGSAIVDSVGEISLTGLADMKNGEWELTGKSGNIRFDEPLIEQAGQLIPTVGERLAQLKQSPQLSPRHRLPLQMASNSQQSATNQGEPLFRADVILNFRVGQQSSDSKLDYDIQTNIDNGQISDLFLPIPLYNVSANLVISPDRFQIENFRASNNQSQLFIDGIAANEQGQWQRNFVVKATNLQIDERIQSILPPGLLKVYRLISPTGTFDLDFDIAQRPGEDWSGELRKFTARNCRVLVDYFRYPVEQIMGEITHQGDRFQMKMNGIAAGQPVSLTGYFGGGPTKRDYDYSVFVNNFPVNERFTEAFGRKDLLSVQSALKSLRLGGVTNFTGRFFRTAETKQQFNMQLTADVREANLNFINFPYQLEGLSGRVSFDSLRDKVFRFENLKARHGHSLLAGDGAFSLEQSPGRLDLKISATRVPIDRDLEKASLISSPQLESLWTDFDLAGTLDIDEIKIDWQPGRPTNLTMNGIQWKDGRITPAAFPYQWNDVVASLNWDGKRLNIDSLNGWHGETYLEIKGTDPEWPTFVEVPSSGPIAWETHFGNVMIVKARFDEDLQRALPVHLADTCQAMDLQGTVNLQLRADMRGWTNNPDVVTANWELQSVLKENSLFAGVRLDKVTGKVRIRDGTWDGNNLRMEGLFELEEAVALQMPFKNIRSPFHLDQQRLIIGSPKFVPPPAYLKTNEYLGKQLRADIYAGQIGYDGLVLLGPRPELTQYRAELNVNDVELAEFAADQSPNARNLKGKVNGIMAYKGIGPSPESITGQGWINITPAAIMDLPAFAQMFALINFRPVGNTAFNYAFGEFGINKGRFEFSRIELRGDALGLIGKGIVGFAAGNQSLINLTFDSRTNNRLPVVGRLIDGLGSNWIRVQVTGTVAQPVPVVQPRIGPLDDAFREFTEAMEKGQNIRPPMKLGTLNRQAKKLSQDNPSVLNSSGDESMTIQQ